MNDEELRRRRRKVTEFNKRAWRQAVQLGLYPGRRLDGSYSQGLPSDHEKVRAFNAQCKETCQRILNGES